MVSASVALAQGDQPSATTHVYTSSGMQLAMYFNDEVRPEGPDTIGNYSYRSRFALHAKDDPQHRGADPCAPTVFAVGTGPDLARDPAHPLTVGKQVPIAPTGGVSLAEIDADCLAKDSPGRTQEDALGRSVEGIRHIEGIPALSKTIDYKVQGRTVIFASAGGPSKDDKGKRTGTESAGYTYVGSMATITNGHLLIWSVTANDVELFNRLLSFHICFDAPVCKAGYDRIVPFKLGMSAAKDAVPR